MAEHLAALRAIVGVEYASDTDADKTQHSRDQSSYPAALPDYVVWPATAAEVSAVTRYANERRLPLVGWGAASGLEGGAMALSGGIVIDFSRMNRIVALHAADFQVTVEPGLLYKDMNRRLARHGLFFPPDPGANASIGGMIANNASGIRTVKYGATRDNVLALEIVLASGEIIRTGSRSIKQSAGYDLTRLFTGSEGTLGLITQATLKLAPLPEHISAITVTFPDVPAAADAVFGIIGAGLNPGALELLDAETLTALAADAGWDMPLAPTLFLEFNGASEASLAHEMTLAREICAECGSLDFRVGLGREARNQLWETRHAAFEIMVRRHPGLSWLVTDVAVPISRYPEMAAFAAAALKRHELPGGIVGHAGDGNLHTVTFYDPANAADVAATQALGSELVHQALALEGTCTGEHGVGVGKMRYLEAEHGAGAVAVMRALKQTLDPNNILNPGKVVALAPA